MSGKRKTFNITKLRVGELSTVDVPAQGPAEMVLMKRAPRRAADESDDDYVNRFVSDEAMKKEIPDEKARRAAAQKGLKKCLVLTSDEMGHAHILDDVEQGGRTSHDKSEGDEYSHSHPWVRDLLTGEITIGAASGHTHVVLKSQPQPVGKSAGSTETPMSETKTTNTPDAAELTKQLETARNELAIVKAENSLSDGERAHYRGLGSDELRKAFRDMSPEARRAELAKASDANPVEFTSADGQIFRKNDDPRLIALAKQNDALAKSSREAAERAERVELEKRAGSDMANLPGETPVKVAFLKALEGIADATVRGKALEILKAANSGITKAFERTGTTGASPAGSSTGTGNEATGQLQALAKAHADKHGVDINKAMTAVLGTPEGVALYDAANKR